MAERSEASTALNARTRVGAKKIWQRALPEPERCLLSLSLSHIALQKRHETCRDRKAARGRAAIPKISKRRATRRTPKGAGRAEGYMSYNLLPSLTVPYVRIPLIQLLRDTHTFGDPSPSRVRLLPRRVPFRVVRLNLPVQDSHLHGLYELCPRARRLAPYSYIFLSDHFIPTFHPISPMFILHSFSPVHMRYAAKLLRKKSI